MVASEALLALVGDGVELRQALVKGRESAVGAHRSLVRLSA